MSPKLAPDTIAAHMHEVAKMMAERLGIHPSHLDTIDGMRRVVLFCFPEKVKELDYSVVKDMLSDPAPKDDVPLSSSLTERVVQLRDALQDPQQMEMMIQHRKLSGFEYRVSPEERAALKANMERDLASLCEKFGR